MTDMRATERLLEVIAEKLIAINEYMVNGTPDEILDAQMAITELRRRGDTLVRADDLRVAVESIDLGELSWVYMDAEKFAPIKDAIVRLENVLVGKP